MSASIRMHASMCHVAEQPQAQLGIADGTWVAELCGLLDQIGAELTQDI